jgi:hypothetical protein
VGLVVLDRDLVGLLVGHGIFQAHPAGKPRPAVPRQCFQTHVDVSKPLASRYSRNCHQVPSIIGIPFPTTHQDVLVVHCVRLDVRDENQSDNGRCDRESRAQPERSLNVNTVAASQRPAPPTVLYLYESSGPKLAWIWGKVYVPMKAPTTVQHRPCFEAGGERTFANGGGNTIQLASSSSGSDRLGGKQT